MKLEDLKVGMEVVMVSPDFVAKNFDRISSGYICKKTHMYLSNDMYSLLIGKRTSINAIDADDPILNVVVAEGFNIPSLWIEKKAPARRRARAGSKNAGDGTPYGPVFLNLLKAHPELKGFTTNRFSKLTVAEKKAIGEAVGITYTGSNDQTLFEDVAVRYCE